jgi:hypothetical protein
MISKKVSLKTYSFRYSFSTDGGAVGSIEAPFTLPENSIVKTVTIRVLNNVTGGAGATVAFGVGTGAGTSDFFTAIAIATLTAPTVLMNFPNNKEVIVSGGEKPSITIAVNALTAGSFDVIVDYFEQ